jgi:transposase
MSDLYWPTDEQMTRLQPFFPKSHGRPRVYDRRVLSDIVFVNHKWAAWRDAPSAYGPHKTLYNRWKRWGERGVFLRMIEGLSAMDAEPRTIMIDATYLRRTARHPACGLKRGSWAADRPHQRRHKHQAARRQRCGRAAFELLHDRWAG